MGARSADRDVRAWALPVEQLSSPHLMLSDVRDDATVAARSACCVECGADVVRLERSVICATPIRLPRLELVAQRVHLLEPGGPILEFGPRRVGVSSREFFQSRLQRPPCRAWIANDSNTNRNQLPDLRRIDFHENHCRMLCKGGCLSGDAFV